MDNSTTDAPATTTRAKHNITTATTSSNINKSTKFLPFLPSSSTTPLTTASLDKNNFGSRANSIVAPAFVKSSSTNLSQQQQHRNGDGVGPAVGGAGPQPNASRAVKYNQSSFYNISSNNNNNSQQNVIFKGNVGTGGGGTSSPTTMRYEDEGTYYHKNLRNKYNTPYNNRHNDYNEDDDEGGKYKLRPSPSKFGKGRREGQQHHVGGGSMQTTLNSYHKTINNQLVMRSMLDYDQTGGGEPNQKLLTWLEEELDSMGIDPVIYRPYVLSILAHSNEEPTSGSRKSSSMYSSPNSLSNSSLPSSSSANEGGGGDRPPPRYCDLHQRPYPFAGGAIANRMKLSGGLLRSKENTQKPTSTTKWMHKRYLQQGNSPTGSTGSLNLLPEEDYCPDCLNSRSYRRAIVIDTLKAATDEPSSVEAFVDELLHRYEKLHHRFDYDDRGGRQAPNNRSKHYGQRHPADEDETGADDDYDDKYYPRRSTYGRHRSFDRRAGQYDEDEDVEEDGRLPQARGTRNVHAQAMQYFAAFPSLSGDGSNRNKEGAAPRSSTSGVSSVSGSSKLPSLSSPQRVFSQQSSIEDSVFGEAAGDVLTNTTSTATTTTTTTTKASGGQWNGQRLILKSAGTTVSSSAIGSSSSNKTGDPGELKTISRKLTTSGKTRLVVAAPPTTQSSGVSTFTTLKKKVSLGNASQAIASNSSALSTNVVTSASSSSSSTRVTLSDKAKMSTKEQEKVFALMPSFMNPMKKDSTSMVTTTATTTTIPQSLSSPSTSYTLSPSTFNSPRTYASWSHWNYKRGNHHARQSMARAASSSGGSQSSTPTMYGRSADHYQQQQHSYHRFNKATTHGGNHNNNSDLVAMRSNEHYHHNAIEATGGGHHNSESRTGYGATSASIAGTTSRKQPPPQSTESLIDLLPSYLKTTTGGSAAKDCDNDSLNRRHRKCERGEEESDKDALDATALGDEQRTTSKAMLLPQHDSMTREEVMAGEENGSAPCSLLDACAPLKECQQQAAPSSTTTASLSTTSKCTLAHDQQQWTTNKKTSNDDDDKSTNINNSAQTSTSTDWLTTMAPTTDTISSLLLLPFNMQQQQQHDGQRPPSVWMEGDGRANNVEQVSMFWNKHSTLNLMNFNTLGGNSNNDEAEVEVAGCGDDAAAIDGFDWTRVPFYHQQDESKTATTTTTTLVNHESTSSAFLEVTTTKKATQRQDEHKQQQQSTASVVVQPLATALSESIATVDSPFQPIEADDNSHDLQALLNEGRQMMMDTDGGGGGRVATGGGSFSASRSELEGYIENRRQIWAQLKANMGSQVSSGLSSLLSLHCDSDSSSMSSSIGGCKFFGHGDQHQQQHLPDLEAEYSALSLSLSSIDNETLSRGGDVNVSSTSVEETSNAMPYEHDVSLLTRLFGNVDLRGHEATEQHTASNNNSFDCSGDSSLLTNLLNDVLGDMPTNTTSSLWPTTNITTPPVAAAPAEQPSMSSLPYSKRHKAKNGFVYGKVESNELIPPPPNRTIVTKTLDGDDANVAEEQAYTDGNAYYHENYYYDFDQDGQQQQEYQQDYGYEVADNYEMSAEEYQTYDEFLQQQQTCQQQSDATTQQQPSSSGGVPNLFNVLQFKTDIRGVDPTVLVSKPSQKPCSFFMDGFCARGDCKFSHDLSSITCKYWMEGFCLKDEHCSFRHSFPDPNETINAYDAAGHGRGSQLDPNAKSFDFSMEDSDFPALSLEEQQQQELDHSDSKNPLKAVFVSTHKQGSCQFSIGPQQQQQAQHQQPHSKNSKHKNRIKLNDLNALDKILTGAEKRAEQLATTKSLSQVLKAANNTGAAAKAAAKSSQQKHEPAAATTTTAPPKAHEDEWPSLMSKSSKESTDFPELPAGSTTLDDTAAAGGAQFRDKVKSAKASRGGKGKRGKCGNGLGKMVPLKGFLEC